MKRVLGFVLIFSMLICHIVAYADEIPEKENGSSDSYEVNVRTTDSDVKQGDTITLSIMLENINISEGKGGVAGVQGKLSYNENIFEIDKFEATNWELMSNGKSFIANSRDGNTVVQNLEIGKVTLKVKNDASKGNTVIKVLDITGSVGELDLADMVGKSKELTLHISDNTDENNPSDEKEDKPEIKDKEIKKIVILSVPDKTSYIEGEKFDTTGMVVVVVYNDDTSEELKNYSYTPTGKLTVDDRKIIITYQKNDIVKTAELPIEVAKSTQDIIVKLTKIEVQSKPSKTEYIVGERFDATGMIIVARYSDGGSKEITNYTISPSEVLKVDDREVKISYSEGEIVVEQLIEIKVNEEKKANENDEKDKSNAEKNSDNKQKTNVDGKDNKISSDTSNTKLTKDSTTASNKLPQTGNGGFLIPIAVIIILTSFVIILGRKCKKNI